MFTLFIILSIVLFITRFILKTVFPKFANKHDGFIFLIQILAIMLLVLAIIGSLFLGDILLGEEVLLNDIARAEDDLEYLERLRLENVSIEGADIIALKEDIRSLKKDLDKLDIYRWWLYLEVLINDFSIIT